VVVAVLGRLLAAAVLALAVEVSVEALLSIIQLVRQEPTIKAVTVLTEVLIAVVVVVEQGLLVQQEHRTLAVPVVKVFIPVLLVLTFNVVAAVVVHKGTQVAAQVAQEAVAQGKEQTPLGMQELL
jgi:hypothetical protein